MKTKTLRKVFNNWKNRIVKFEVDGFDLKWHEDRTGAKLWLVCLRIVSLDLHHLRRDLGLKIDPEYFPHIAVLEKEV